MLYKYILNGEELDSIDLKVLLVTKGMNIQSDEIFERFGKTNRLSSFKDPQSCNCLLLPDNTVVHITNIGPQSPFSMAIDEDSVVYIEYEGEFVRGPFSSTDRVLRAANFERYTLPGYGGVAGP